ncbi:MAG TPA: autotransporter-associated beta strand repeat-containing protein, partial [Planctomycetota bacterium]|nr:autotransporter-associated beta strand repeat-containing protein [Planctomycetota bacterium]
FTATVNPTSVVLNVTVPATVNYTWNFAGGSSGQGNVPAGVEAVTNATPAGRSGGLWSTATDWSGSNIPVGSVGTSLNFNTNLAAYFARMDINGQGQNGAFPLTPFVLNSMTLSNTTAAQNILWGALHFSANNGSNPFLTQSAGSNQPFTIYTNLFADSPLSFTGSGAGAVNLGLAISGGGNTLTSNGTAVVGAGTGFGNNNNVYVGDYIMSAGQMRRVVAITDANDLTTDTAFNPALAGSTFAWSRYYEGLMRGAGSVTFNGSYTTGLFGPNDYSGGTTITAGGVVAGLSNSLSNGTITFNGVGAGGNLLASTTTGPNTLTNALTFAGDSTLNSGAGTSSLTLTGNATLTGAGVQRNITVTGAQSQATVAASPTGATEVGNIVTINTVANHGLVAGQVIQVSGVPISGYNGTYTVLSVPSAAQLTYFDPNATLGGTGGGAVTSATDFALLAGNIGQSGGSNGFIKLGGGLLGLAGNNTFNGQVDLNAGRVLIGNPVNLGSGSVLGFNGGTLTYIGDVNAALAQATVNLNGAGTVEFLNSVPSTLTISGTIGGVGSYNQSNSPASTLTNAVKLTGNNGFTGGVTVNHGRVIATNSNSMGLGPKTVALSNAAGLPELHLDPQAGPSINLAANLSFSTSSNVGAITNDSGNNSINGNVTLFAGGDTTLLSNAGSLAMTGNFTGNAAGLNLRLRGTGTGTISGNISDGASTNMQVLKDAGAGTWTLTGTNTYGGVTTAGAGTLAFSVSSNLGSAGVANSIAIPAGGTLQYLGTATSTIATSAVPGASEATNTVTITTTAAHNLVVGQAITIAGVGVAGYNGPFTVATVPSATTFTYNNPNFANLANSGSGTVTATSTPVSTVDTVVNSGASETGNVVTIKTTSPHGLMPGQLVAISGMTVTAYNSPVGNPWIVTSVPSATSFTYTNAASALATDGGGTVTAQAFTGTDLTSNRSIALSGAGTATLAVNGNALIVSGAISGTNATPLSVTGNGSLLLTATNTYTGTLSFGAAAPNGGMLVTVNGSMDPASAIALSGSLPPASPTHAITGTRLRGTGSVGIVTATDPANGNAVVWPGIANAPEQLAANETLTATSVDLSNGGKLAIVISNVLNNKTQSLVTTGAAAPTVTIPASPSPGTAATLSFAVENTQSLNSFVIVNTGLAVRGVQNSFGIVIAVAGHQGATSLAAGVDYDLIYRDTITPSTDIVNPSLGTVLLNPVNQIVIAFKNTSVTPVKVQDFAAASEGSGALLSWHAVSEYQNLGFNVYRRNAGFQPAGSRRSSGNGWTRV